MAVFGPNFYPGQSGSTVTTFTIDASNDGIAYILSIEEDATITAIVVRQGTVTGTSPVYKIGFQTLTTAGIPDGTFTGGGSEESVTFTPTAGNDSTAQVHTLDNSKAVSRGDLICIVIAYSSGTIDGGNNSSFARTASTQLVSVAGFPYSATEAAGTWARQDDSPFVIMRSSTKSYGNCWDTTTAVVLQDDTDPDEAGVAFTVPSGVTTNYQVVGLSLRADFNNVSTSVIHTYSLYSDTTLLQSIALTGTIISSTSSENQWIMFDEEILSTLVPGTEYILAIKTSSTVANLNLRTYEYLTSGDLRAAAGSASEALSLRWMTPSYVTRNNGGAWTAVTTRIFPLVPMISTMTASAGGGLKLAGTGGLAG